MFDSYHPIQPTYMNTYLPWLNTLVLPVLSPIFLFKYWCKIYIFRTMASLGCRVGRLLPTLHRLSRQTITVARYRFYLQMCQARVSRLIVFHRMLQFLRIYRFTCWMSSYMECGEKYNVENRKWEGPNIFFLLILRLLEIISSGEGGLKIWRRK